MMYAILTTLSEPFSTKEALAFKPWRFDMQTNFDCIERSVTWTLIRQPHERRVIGVCWVLLGPTKPIIMLLATINEFMLDFYETFAFIDSTFTTIRPFWLLLPIMGC